MEHKETIKQFLQEGNRTFTSLAVFDFDGTLVDTPLSDTHKDIYFQKKGVEWPHQGWWGKADSLDMDVFDMPTIESVVADYRKVRANPDTLVVMLTGRIAKLSPQVEAILNSKGLKFDRYIYNNGGGTLVSKIASLEGLLKEFPTIKHVSMWEDRDEHVNAFKAWGAAQDGINFNITHVDSNRH